MASPHVLADRALNYLRPLLRYARGEIRAYEALGLLPRGQVQPEDVVDAALIDALRHADEAPATRRAEFRWLRGFVQRVLRRELDEARRRRGQRSLFEPVGGAGRDESSVGPPRRLIDLLPDPKAPVPEQVFETREFQDALLRLLRELPAAWREPFLLQVRDGLSLTEIGKLEGITPREARRRIGLAREFLRERLGEEYEPMPGAPPTERLFELLERVEPTPDQLERAELPLRAVA